MRPSSLCIALTPVTFLLLCALRPVLSQVVGCDAPGMDCPTKDDASSNSICSFYKNDFGATSFSSNITSDGPLTWTAMAVDGKENGANYAAREFYLGTPATLDLSKVTNFGSCSTVFYNFTNILQPHPNSSEEGDCSAVMGGQCARDVVGQVRNELLKLLENNTSRYSPCDQLYSILTASGPPSSCLQQFEGATYLNGISQGLTKTSGLTSHEGCSVTPGGSSYNMLAVGGEDTRVTFNPNFGLEPPGKQYLKSFQTGFSPLLTLFYNEPWNPATTGPVPFLSQPEVHLTCVRPVLAESKESGSHRTPTALSSSLLVLVGSVVWLSATL